MPNKDNNNNETEIKRLQRILMQKPKDTNVLFELAMVFLSQSQLRKSKRAFSENIGY